MTVGVLDLEDIEEIALALLDKGLSLGIFDSHSLHEPKSAPQGKLHLSAFGAALTPLAELSGLNVASVRVEFNLVILRDMFGEPADMIDPETMGAAGRLMNSIANGFTLDDTVHAVDVLGAYGEPLRAQAGYITIGGGGTQGGGKMFRVMQVFAPVILADCWTLGA